MAAPVDVPAVRLALVIALLISVAFDFAACQGACRVGEQFYAIADVPTLWPVPNPGLVAPIQIEPEYPDITYPLMSEFNGESLAIPLPETFTGGFTLVADPDTSAGSSFNTEEYRLTSMEIRLPGDAPEGIGQVLSHSLEVVLMHQQVGGSYWASVVVPFVVSTSSAYDPLYAITWMATMPTTVGEQQPMVLSSAQVLELGKMYGNSTFLNYWTTNPTNCLGYNASTRKFMRSQQLNTGYDTYKQLLTTLQYAPGVAPQASTESPWIVNSCMSKNGTCTKVIATDVTTQLNSELQTQSNDVLEVRERKALMDSALIKLVNDTNDTVGNLNLAISARQDLATANSELISIMASVDQLEAWVNSTTNLVFDADMPPQTSTVVESLINGTLEAAGTSTPSTAASLLVAATATNENHCDMHHMSPVDINTKFVVDPVVISPELRQPLKFVEDVLVTTSDLQLVKSRGRMRISSTEHLGSVVFNDLPHPISYVDIVVPGEHAVNGVAGDAEAQLVHIAPDGNAAIGIALPLNAAGAENTWIGALLQDNAQTSNYPVVSSTITELHDFLRRGSVDRYFRYDGTLTSPPCTSTQWVVVEEPGLISKPQLLSLERIVSESREKKLFLATAPQTRQRFHASLVAFGTMRLVSQVTAAGLSPVSSPGKGSRNNLRKRRINV